MILDVLLSLAGLSIVILACRFAENRRGWGFLPAVLLGAFLVFLVYITMIYGNRSELSGINFRLPLPFMRTVLTGRFGRSQYRSLLNMLLFIPFGYLASELLSPARRKTASWLISTAGFLLSLGVESCQLLLRRGVFELDDLVKNTLGALLGCWLYRKLNQQGRENSEESAPDLPGDEDETGN